MSLDPITTEVVLSRVRETTEAMAHALFHSGYSPILRESQDGTAGLTDADGRVIMVGGGIQYHSMRRKVNYELAKTLLFCWRAHVVPAIMEVSYERKECPDGQETTSRKDFGYSYQ